MARRGGSNGAAIGGMLGLVIAAIFAVFIYFLVVGKGDSSTKKNSGGGTVKPTVRPF